MDVEKSPNIDRVLCLIAINDFRINYANSPLVIEILKRGLKPYQALCEVGMQGYAYSWNFEGLGTKDPSEGANLGQAGIFIATLCLDIGLMASYLNFGIPRNDKHIKQYSTDDVLYMSYCAVQGIKMLSKTR